MAIPRKSFISRKLTTVKIGFYYFYSIGRIGFPSLEVFNIMLIVGFAGAALILRPRGIKAMYLLIKHGRIESSIGQVAMALLKSLHQIEEITTDFDELELMIEPGDQRGTVFCHLEQATTREKKIFMNSLQELLDPINNPRYILTRRSRFFGRVFREDYLAVPSVIGSRRNQVEIFAKHWKTHVGRTKIIYTRNKEGRIVLLRARNNSLSSAFREKSDRVTRWK
jgi:hypothetical protein